MSDAEAKRYYSVDEANAQIDRLRELFGLTMQLRAQLKTLYQRLDDAGYPPGDQDLEDGPADEDEDEEDDDEEHAGDVSDDGLDEDEERGGSTLPPEVARDRGWFRGLVEALREKLDEIQACGCIIKDVEVGLVDWPAVHEGREVY